MYRKLVLTRLPDPFQQMPLHTLPSTSPAHASITRAEKLSAWKIITEPLEKGSA